MSKRNRLSARVHYGDQMSMFSRKYLLIYLAFFILAFTQFDVQIGKNNTAHAFSLEKTSKLIIQPLSSAGGLTAGNELHALQATWRYLDFHSTPPGRFGFSMTANPINDVALLFGGLSSTLGEMNDLWMTDGLGWIQFQTPNSPEKRAGACLAYDEARQEAVLFGGYDYGALLGDTWVFDGIDWIQQNPTHSPSPRSHASMAYDPDRNLTILFGGQGDTGGQFWEPLGDMWAWDGADWEQLFPDHLPPIRVGENMAYDRARHVLLLFGGAIGGGLLGDTWIWDGTDWIEQQPDHSPSLRADFGMTFDDNNQGVMLYGGQGAPLSPTDTWSWDGNDWQQVHTFHEPPEALSYMARLVYSPSLQTVMLVNDHRIKYFDPDGNIVFTEHLEAWALTYQHLSFLPILAQK
jgi:hypothetical protein